MRQALANPLGVLTVLLTMAARGAFATAPASPAITEPAVDGHVANYADVHMEATGFSDTDGDTHACTDWEIATLSTGERVWWAPCIGGLEKVHVHFGDGHFLGSLAGKTELVPDTDYRLGVRFKDGREEWSPWTFRTFRTSVAGPPGQPGDVPFAVRQTGYKVEIVASGFQLPVNIAFVPTPGTSPGSPLFYVAELYGTVKVVTRAGTVRDYATGLLNFTPTGRFPGNGEQGLAGIAVDPPTGDLFVSLLYEDTASPLVPKPHYPKVLRLRSTDGGLTMSSMTTVLDMRNEPQGQSHQVSNVTVGPDGKLYVHNGDGFTTATAQDLASFRGKILRLNKNGSAPADNPFYNAADGITARDYVYAYGVRNPFGGAWRTPENQHFIVENGPTTDRMALLVAGRNYLWDGTDGSMLNHALYTWTAVGGKAAAPVNMAFWSGRGYVSLSGATWSTGPQAGSKNIVEFIFDASGNRTGGPATIVEYTGVGKGTVVPLATGPDGLYFSEFYKDVNAATPIERGARVFRLSRTSGSSDNLALGKPATASSAESSAFAAGLAVDGNTTTRWSSAFSDPQWLQVDLGATYTLSRVVLRWEAAYGRSYQIQASNDGTAWSTLFTTTTGDGGVDDIAVTGSGRYVRMNGTARGTTWGYSLWEMEVYGSSTAPRPTPTPTPTPLVPTPTPTATPTPTPRTLITPTPTPTPASGNLALGRPATASSSETSAFTPNLAVDGSLTTRWSSLFSDPQWIQVDLGVARSVSRVVLRWEAAYGRGYQIQVSNDGTAWTTLFTTTTGDGGVDDIALSGSGRYVRMNGTARGTAWGYSLWEIEVYGGGTTTPTPTPTPVTRPTPTPTPTPITQPTPTPTPTPSSQEWRPGVTYATGAIVTYEGVTYRCIQGHTSQSGWEPPNTPALWSRL